METTMTMTTMTNMKASIRMKERPKTINNKAHVPKDKDLYVDQHGHNDHDKENQADIDQK